MIKLEQKDIKRLRTRPVVEADKLREVLQDFFTQHKPPCGVACICVELRERFGVLFP